MTESISPVMTIREYREVVRKADGAPISQSTAYWQIHRLPPECFFRLGRRIFLRRDAVMELFGSKKT